MTTLLRKHAPTETEQTLAFLLDVRETMDKDFHTAKELVDRAIKLLQKQAESPADV